MNKGKPPWRRTDMEPQGSQGSEPAPVARLGPHVKMIIGQKLGDMYAPILKEGVPDRFADILRGLDDPSDEGSKEGFKNEPS